MSRNKERRKKLTSMGLCNICGKEPADPGYVTCSVCREIENVRNRARRAKAKGIIPTDTDKKKQKMCVKCGRNPVCANSAILCQSCYDKEVTEKIKEITEKPIPKAPDEKKEIEPKTKNGRRVVVRTVPDKWPYGWCYVCAKQTGDAEKLCNKHKDWIYGIKYKFGEGDKS